MDLISRVLSAIRVRAPLLSVVQMGGDVTLEIGPGTGAPFHHIISGQARIASPDFDTIQLVAGDFLMLPRGSSHYLETGNGAPPLPILSIAERQGVTSASVDQGLDRPLYFEFGPMPRGTRILSGLFSIDSAEATYLTRQLPTVLNLTHGDNFLAPWLEAALDLVTRELEHPEAGFSAVSCRAVEMFFIAALRDYFLHSEQPVGWVRGMAHKNVCRALDMIHRQPSHMWSLEELASKAGQSRSAFAHAFRTTVGQTPLSYLRSWRMHLAATRLRTTTPRLSDLATELGYDSDYSFARAFKSELGVTPTKFRKMVQDASSP